MLTYLYVLPEHPPQSQYNAILQLFWRGLFLVPLMQRMAERRREKDRRHRIHAVTMLFGWPLDSASISASLEKQFWAAFPMPPAMVLLLIMITIIIVIKHLRGETLLCFSPWLHMQTFYLLTGEQKAKKGILRLRHIFEIMQDTSLWNTFEWISSTKQKPLFACHSIYWKMIRFLSLLKSGTNDKNVKFRWRFTWLFCSSISP